MILRNYISTLFNGVKSIICLIHSVRNGQSGNYAILQESHRLEKGLCNSNPRPEWGYEKAMKIVDLINQEREKATHDEFAIKVGESVLSAYVNYKDKSEPNLEKLLLLKQNIKNKRIQLISDIDYGGSIEVRKEDILIDYEMAKHLFNTRHSIRDFSETPVSKENLEKAISLALMAPSACNRQATQIYVLGKEQLESNGINTDVNADKYLIITGNKNAFSLSELNDWIVSSSIFCGYLTLALHTVGIGACCFRKDIVFDRNSDYNKKIKNLCNIPDDEQIILEIAIGNYKDKFLCAVSSRREVKDIVHYYL